ncbi:MAG: hypothetical protein LH606_02540 [Cytophagaceae bacterium]|nr:hypothetical protein [Cytophagaceae bacterium]
MANPAVGSHELVPVQALGFGPSPAEYEVEFAVAIRVDQGGEAVIAVALVVHRQLTVDEVVFEAVFFGPALSAMSKKKYRKGIDPGR